MSTRCNIILRSPAGAKIYLYRHCDGYPSGAGQTIASVWLSLTSRYYDASQTHDPYWKAKWIRPFFDQLYKTTGHGGDPHHEITAGLHGDIEFLYVIDFSDFVDFGKPISEPMIRMSPHKHGITEEEVEAITPRPLSELSHWIYEYEEARRKDEEA